MNNIHVKRKKAIEELKQEKILNKNLSLNETAIFHVAVSSFCKIMCLVKAKAINVEAVMDCFRQCSQSGHWNMLCYYIECYRKQYPDAVSQNVVHLRFHKEAFDLYGSYVLKLLEQYPDKPSV